MSSNKRDPDMVGSFAALRRAAKRAREVARQTSTPCYVMIKGEIVDLTERDKNRAKPNAKKRRPFGKKTRSI